jgi:hypothetical protein
MKRRLITLTIILFIALGLTTSALAQSYYFSLDQETVNAYWNSDGTLALDYVFRFTNQPGAHVIDFVDVGLPNKNYDFGSISADVNGQSVTISSDYQGTGTGVAVDLGAYAIPSGQSGLVHVYVGRISNVLYSDDQNKNDASGVFSPTWFESQYVTGSTDLTVIFHLPPGVKPDEPRYHMPSSDWTGPQEPQTGLDNSGRIIYTWHDPNANAYTQYKFGASFPKSYVPASAIVQPSLFETLGISSAALFNCACIGLFALLFFGLPIFGAVANRRRKLQYLPPKISIEGHGIKRGLTAVEAAILMQEPLDKVMTMILFGVVKKNAAEVATRDPLTLKVSDPLPDGLHYYENEFLEAFKQSDARKRRTALQDMTVKLVKAVSDKMKGFSRRETVDYYKKIMERAWQEVETADTPEVKSQLFDKNLEWTMLDHDYDDRTRRVFTGPIFVPMWWGRYDPGYGGATAGAGIGRPSTGGMPAMTSTQGRGPSASLPHLPGADFAASMVGGVQTFSSKVIGDLTGFTSKVTSVTNPPPKPSTSSGGWRSGGGGGGGCACACACAGCACACAGGGR